MMMPFEDMIKLLAAAIISFGGGAVIVIALSKWLGDLWARRILQEEEHELHFAKSSYEHYLDLILTYYKIFYRHYRMCQRAVSADIYRKPDGTITNSREEFLATSDIRLKEWAENEGEIRLLLPKKILDIHLESVNCFNRLHLAVDEFDTTDATRKEREEAFLALDDVKNKLELQLREFLRTEKLVK
jgi:hypothetical protein